VDNERNPRRFESVYSRKVRAGRRRTYFFDVRQTKGDDYYLTLTESTRKFNGDGYERHKIFLYKEDFNRFMESLNDVIDHVKTELMPEYDYDEYTRRHEEYEARREAGEFDEPNHQNKNHQNESHQHNDDSSDDSNNTDDNVVTADVDSEEDMSW